MRSIVIGQVADSLGHCRTTEVRPWGNHGGAQLLVEHSRWSSDDYATTQPKFVPLDWCHGREVGVVKYLRRGHGSLWAVAEVDHLEELPTVEGLSFSPQLVADRAGRITLEALALTDDPASCAIGKVQFIPGNLTDILRRRTRQQVPHYDLLKAAVEHRGGTSTLVDVDRTEARSGAHWSAPTPPAVHGQPATRSAARPTTRSAPRPAPTSTRQRYMVVDGEVLPIEHTAPYFGPVTVRR